MHRRRIARTGRAGVALLVLGVGAALLPAGGAAAAPAALSVPSASSAPAPSVDPAVGVRRIGLQAADLRLKGMPAGASVGAFEGGDRISTDPGESTLNACGYRFRSEAFRVARHQTLLLVKGQYSQVSSEVVAYDTPAHAALALAEWRAAVRGCRSKAFFPPLVPGAHSVRYDRATSVRRSGMPVRDYAWTVHQLTDKATGAHFSWITVLQQHGRYLDIVWSSSFPRPAASRGQASAVAAIALATGRRLAAL